MKKIILIVITIFTVTSFTSCKKEGCTDSNATNYNSKAKKDDGSCTYPSVQKAPDNNSPCGGSTKFCMNYGGTTKSGDASLSQPPGGRYRVYWSTTSGTYEQLELDIYGSSAGIYAIDTAGTPGKAVAEYFHATNGAVKAAYGQVEVTSFDITNGLEGNFTFTMMDSTKITSGNFYKVN
jgi:hypothetical protein